MAVEKTWTFQHTLAEGCQAPDGTWTTKEVHPSLTVLVGASAVTVNFDAATGLFETPDAGVADALRRVPTVEEIGGRASGAGKPVKTVLADE